jgi:hypothetical protein
MAFLSDTLLSVIVGGIIGFGSSIGVNRVEAYLTRPILSVSEEVILADTDRYGGGSWNIRVKVENQGKTAAEDCKASIIPLSKVWVAYGARVRRVAWMIPKEDFAVTINANDSEYIDLGVFAKDGNLILSTERGYKEPRKIRTGGAVEGQLKVSASNAKQCVKNIWIINTRDFRQGVHFSKPEGFPSEVNEFYPVGRVDEQQ